MIKSMTAYGRASGPSPLGKLVVEIHSVNRKMLDISLNLPKDFLRFDIEVRKVLSSLLERGQISIRMTLLSEEGTAGGSVPSIAQCRSCKEAWEKIARDLGYDPQSAVSFSFLGEQLRSLSPVEPLMDEGVVRKALLPIVEEALKELLKMKQIEGEALKQELQKRLLYVEKHLKTIESKGRDPLNRYRQKLIERVREVAEMQESDPRLLHEVALYAEKLDITEELVRLASHLAQFRQLFETKEKSVGRTLDFLTQEMQRESNTISAKSADAEISSLIVGVKSELEKVREQVQNIE
jgi:uncharacterized protein YicC (UPF0701 family)